MLISSQPIDELEGFKDKNYCVFEIEPWGIEQVKSLMETFQINDDIIEIPTALSPLGELSKGIQDLPIRQTFNKAVNVLDSLNNSIE